MRPKWILALTLALVIFGLSAFFVTRNQIINRRLWEFSENEVSVRIEMVQRPSGQQAFIGTFTPTREHFHLYSKDLPKNGLNGLGRPTLLEVTSLSGAIRLTGSLKADQSTRELYFETLGLSFPVYPEGAVMLSLPFEWTGAHDRDSIELSVTYMACSDQTCLPPVIDRRFTVEIFRKP